MVRPSMDNPHPAEYEPRSVAAVRSVLLEIGQLLGSYRGKFVVIGGAVPWLLLDNPQMRHIGSLDVDLSLDPVALEDGEYAMLVETLLRRGYRQAEDLRKFQLVREVPVDDGGPAINIVVDFLMPRDAVVEKRETPLVAGFAVQKASGADLALRYAKIIEIAGVMPLGGENRVEIAVASVPALLAMKGFALNNRQKEKDAYDVYYCIRNYAGGPEALAADCRLLLDQPEAVEGFKYLAAKFESRESVGPVWTARFAEAAGILDGRTSDQWQTDAFGQVDLWARAMDLR